MRLLSIFALLTIVTFVSADACWKGAWGRGVGTPMDSCPPGKTVQNLLCYKDCPGPEWTKIGPVCWNYNTFPWGAQGIGVGTIMQCAPGKDQQAGLCYDSCPPNSNGVGPVCWGTCPAGY